MQQERPPEGISIILNKYHIGNNGCYMPEVSEFGIWWSIAIARELVLNIDVMMDPKSSFEPVWDGDLRLESLFITVFHCSWSVCYRSWILAKGWRNNCVDSNPSSFKLAWWWDRIGDSNGSAVHLEALLWGWWCSLL